MHFTVSLAVAVRSMKIIEEMDKKSVCSSDNMLEINRRERGSQTDKRTDRRTEVSALSEQVKQTQPADCCHYQEAACPAL